jgi:molybdopterin-guanine dinucleotide biosynthesis protein A
MNRGVTEPGDALASLVERLREEDTPISPHVVETEEQPVFGLLAAQGPNAVAAPGEYALVVEAIREGYLLHYGQSRLLRGHDEDLALLAGDYLYAIGLERLAALGDAEAVAELAELIARSAQLHAEGREDEAPELWHVTALAIGGEGHGDRQEGPGRPESIDSALPEASC